MSSKLGLVWDAWNTEHIKKHSVSISEVEDAYRQTTVKQTSYGNRMLFLGKTKKGRLLAIICSQKKQTNYYVVSARDASRKERRWYDEETNTDKTI